MSGLSNFFMGQPARYEQRFRGGPEQYGLYQGLTNASRGPGAGGAYGDAADYYRSLLSNNPADLQSMAAPDIRRFNQVTIPELSQQFAGLGAGALSSSGFRNAAVQAGTDLQERIAALRAGLRGQGAQGLMNVGQQGLGEYFNNMYTPRTPGFLETFAPAAAQAATAFAPGGISAILPFLQRLFSQSNSQSGVQ